MRDTCLAHMAVSVPSEYVVCLHVVMQQVLSVWNSLYLSGLKVRRVQSAAKRKNNYCCWVVVFELDLVGGVQ